MRAAAYGVAKMLQRQLQSLWTNDASHPAARQKRPCGLSRWVLLAIYMVYATLTSSVYFGWRSMSALLVRSGQFEWVCDDQPDAQGGGSQDPPTYLCELQDAKIHSLFTIAMACHFTCSALAGWMLDTVGPKTVAVFGQLLNSLAWMLLGFSGRHFQSVYPAFVFMGAGADVSVYPTLLIVSLFPQNTAIVMALMGACISTSFFVPYVLKVFWQRVDISFRMLCIIYVAVGPVLCMVLSFFFVPHKAFKGVDTFDICVEAAKVKKESAGSPTGAQGGVYAAAAVDPQAPADEREAGDPALLQMDTMADSSAVNKNSAVAGMDVGAKTGLVFSGMESEGAFPRKMQQQEHVSTDTCEGGEITGRSAYDGSGENCPGGEKSLMLGRRIDLAFDGSRTDTETKNTASPDAEDFGAFVDDPRFKKHQVSFLSQSLTFLYFGICAYFVVCGWAMAFFQEAAGRFLTPAVEHNLELLTPLSTIPCILFGFLINRLGIMPVIFMLNTCGVVMYICVLCAASSIVAQHLSVVCFFFYISIFTTQMYVYIESTFDSSHFGKLIGGASMLGGLLSLLSNVLYGDITVRRLLGDVRPVSGVLLGLLCLTYPMLCLMVIKRRRRSKAQQLEINQRVQELQGIHFSRESVV